MTDHALKLAAALEGLEDRIIGSHDYGEHDTEGCPRCVEITELLANLRTLTAYRASEEGKDDVELPVESHRPGGAGEHDDAEGPVLEEAASRSWGLNELTGDALRAQVQAGCNAAGSVAAWAREHGIHDEVVGLFLRGKRPAEPALLAALGLYRVVTYRASETDRRQEIADQEDRLKEYLQDYEFRGDTDYRPNEAEQLLIEDALRGWIAGEEVQDSELALGEDARPPFAGVGVAATPSGLDEEWFDEVEDFLDDYSDAEIIDGTTHPNKAMRLLYQLREVMGR